MPPTLPAASREYRGSFGGPDFARGVALRAGLLAALKPHKRVFPLAGCHP